MAGYSPALPFRRNSEDGIALTKTMMEVIKQNFKNLVLTNPGERVMLPDFGVGIRRFLFEMNDTTTHGKIDGMVRSQTKKYMPFVAINQIAFNPQSSASILDANDINIEISYSVPSVGQSDVLSVKI